MSDLLPIRRALVSVWDKAGLGRLAEALHAHGAEIVSTGSTAAVIRQLGVPVKTVEEVTRHPELLDGRVKTLHPAIHAGLLADLRKPAHRTQLDEAGIAPFDLVVCNLYPFERTVADPAATPGQVIEQIDVGGPSMLRAAAKNHARVAVVCDTGDYPALEEALAAGGTTAAQRRELAGRAFARTAAYDAAIAGWFAGGTGGADGTEGGGVRELPATLTVVGQRVQALRYGENPHQRAAFYRTGPDAWGLAAASQLGGKDLSYNNLLDTDAALGLARDLAAEPAAVIVKHTNPCGVGTGATLEAAYAAAYEGDPVSAFGGVVALTRELDAATARRIAEVFTEVVAAPRVSAEAADVLRDKKSLRLLEVDPAVPAGLVTLRSVAGGLLAQEPDAAGDPGDDGVAAWTLAAGPELTEDARADLELAWRVVRHAKSNAIVLVRDRRLVGLGSGQVSRVDAARIAVAKAGERALGAVAASDAFFPFPDGLETLAAAGVRAVVQPGGSVRDAEVAAAADAAGVTLLHTGRRSFRH